MKPTEIQAVVRVAQVYLKVMNQRALTLLGMVICAGLFAWVMLAPDWTRLAGACAFALLVYWPIVRRENAEVRQPEGGSE